MAPRDSAQLRVRQVAQAIRKTPDETIRLRLFISAEPPLTGDPRFDALLAAAAEHVAVQAGVASPGWTCLPSRFLDGFWWVSDLPSARARAVVTAPAAFRRRGVLIDRADLEAV